MSAPSRAWPRRSWRRCATPTLACGSAWRGSTRRRTSRPTPPTCWGGWRERGSPRRRGRTRRCASRSVALYLLGEAPVRVAAHGKSYLQPNVEDVVFLTMEFGSGVLVHVQLSWLDPHKERKLTVVGAKKMVVFDDMEAREKLRIYDKGVERPPEYGSYGEADRK